MIRGQQPVAAIMRVNNLFPMKLRFSIRDLLWLTLVAGMAVGWLLQTRRLTRERDELKSQLKDANRSLAASKEQMKWAKVKARAKETEDGIKMNELMEKL